MSTKYLIIGSGVGGLSLGSFLKAKGELDFKIVDRCESLPMNLSNGVHYLHSGELGLPFVFDTKEIVSTEEIWNPRKDEFKKLAHIPEMMDYSMKVMGLRHPSSIMDPGGRSWKTYIPYSNDMNDLLKGFQNYIGEDKFEFGQKMTSINLDKKFVTFESALTGTFENVRYDKLITTSPLNCLGDICGLEIRKEFKHQPVFITNYKAEKIVPNWLISIYISDVKFPVYRITVMNNIISMESLHKLSFEEEAIVKYHLERYFEYKLESKTYYYWDTGRIWGLNKEDREEVVKMFEKDDIHLCGRFARWDGKLEITATIKQAKEVVDQITTAYYS